MKETINTELNSNTVFVPTKNNCKSLQEGRILRLLKTNANYGNDGLELLINTYGKYVYTIVKNALPKSSKQDIEECASDVFYCIYKNREKIDTNKGSLKAFVCTVAKRRAIDYLRKNGCPNSLNIDSIIAEESQPNTLDYGDKEILIRAIKALNYADGQIIIRKYYFKESIKEIAKTLNMKEGTVYKRCAKAIEKLSAILKREDF